MTDVRVEVANALYWDLAVPRDRVTVKVHHGVVTLTGVVERAYERSCAEVDVLRVPGVICVRNAIVVSAAQQFSELRTAA